MTGTERPATPPSRTEEARASRGWDKITIRAPATVTARARALAVDGRTLADILKAGCNAIEEGELFDARQCFDGDYATEKTAMSTSAEQRDRLIDSILDKAACLRLLPVDVDGLLGVTCERYADNVVARYASDLFTRPGWHNIGQAMMSVMVREHPANRMWAAVFYDRVDVVLWASVIWRRAYETARFGEPKDYWAEEDEIRAQADAAYQHATNTA